MPELLRQLCSPTNHRFAGVSCDNLHAKTGEANRQLSGSARTIEDVSVRRQETEDVIERRSELGWSQFCIRDEPLVHLGKRVITPHNYNLRHAGRLTVAHHYNSGASRFTNGCRAPTRPFMPQIACDAAAPPEPQTACDAAALPDLQRGRQPRSD